MHSPNPIGTLLKLERTKQNKGQKEVCYGICVPSYLSKIEHGSVTPDEEIVEKLFRRLGIAYEGNRPEFAIYGEEIEKYFYSLHYRLDTKNQYASLLKHDLQLSYSALAIDWLLVKGLEGEPVRPQLKPLRDNMSAKQRAYDTFLRFDEYTDSAERVLDIEEASGAVNNSFAMLRLCMAYFLHGDYSSIHRMESRIVAMALEEGNTFSLAEYYLLNGSAYACLGMEEMMMTNYNRAIRLLQNTGWKEELWGVYYNIGSTYINLYNYDLALEYLHKSQEMRKTPEFLTLHKLAITYIRSNRLKEGRDYLEQMKEMLLSRQIDTELEHLIYEEALMECQEDFPEKAFLADPKYLELLERLITVLKRERHFGFLYFYRDMVVEAYKKQRKYKQALEFEQEISSKITNERAK